MTVEDALNAVIANHVDSLFCGNKLGSSFTCPKCGENVTEEESQIAISIVYA